jgi:hypothetical protein
MKNFDLKWQALAAKARQAPRREAAAPAGFASRVMARTRAREDISAEEIWWRLIVRFLGLAIPVLILCALLEGRHLGEEPLLETGLENTVAEILYRL